VASPLSTELPPSVRRLLTLERGIDGHTGSEAGGVGIGDSGGRDDGEVAVEGGGGPFAAAFKLGFSSIVSVLCVSCLASAASAIFCWIRIFSFRGSIYRALALLTANTRENKRCRPK
jgi:hypothetical protein